MAFFIYNDWYFGFGTPCAEENVCVCVFVGRPKHATSHIDTYAHSHIQKTDKQG